jgi:hypothetical protein
VTIIVCLAMIVLVGMNALDKWLLRNVLEKLSAHIEAVHTDNRALIDALNRGHDQQPVFEREPLPTDLIKPKTWFPIRHDDAEM